MSRFTKKVTKKAGLPPGTLIHNEIQKELNINITFIDYSTEEFNEKKIERIEECFALKDTPSVSWINLDGINDIALIEKIGQHFGIHALTLEDIITTGQRPKMEDFGDYLYIVLKMLYYDNQEKKIIDEQVSLILGKNFVISFQEKPGDVFDIIRERIRNNKGKIRKMSNDYLAYSLIDAIVDNYFIILENIGEKLENMEQELITNPIPKILHNIHHIKRELLFLRKSVWPFRELISALTKGETNLINANIAIYLRDVYDHSIQVMDTVETFRDIINGMLDIYLSSVSNKMNEIMKVLTIFASIFIPLTFIVGIYGMNFKYIPELDWKWGYLTVWLIMLSVTINMLLYFKRKKWF